MATMSPASCCSSPPTACGRTRVEEFSDDGDTPGFRELLRKGTKASDNGLLTQAPPNTGAGWFTLATGAWPGVHGSTNNTFHINGALSASGAAQTFSPSRTAAFDNGVLQAETLAQSAERAGKRVAQIEWAGGRGGAINGPTLDFRNFRSGRGVATNYIAPEDSPTFTASFGLQFDHPMGFAGNNPFLQAAPSPATGWTNVPKSYSPAKEMRLRVLDGLTPNTSVDKYGLNAYIYDSRNDHRTKYDRVLFSKTKSGNDSVGNLEEGEWADVKVTLNTRPTRSNGKTGAFLVKVERLDSDLSQVRLFHTSVTRAIATWNGWSERGFTGTFEDFVAERFPSSQAGDFAVLEAGIVSEETYIEQGEYWEKSYHPLIKYVIDKHRPDLAMVGYPVTDEVQHQFLGLVTRKLPNGANNPSYDDVNLDGKRDNRVKQRERFIEEAYEGSDTTMRLAQDRMRDNDLTTFVGSDHGFAPQFLAIDASKVLVDLGLLSHPQTPTAGLRDRRDDRQGEGLLRRRRRADLPEPVRARPGGRVPADRRPASTTRPAPRGGDRGGRGRPHQGRLPGPEGHQGLDPRRPARELEGHRPRLHQGRGPLHPQRGEQHGRHGPPDPHGRRRRLQLPAVPVRRGDARHADRAVGVLRPARLRAGRAGPALEHQHARDVPGRRRPDRPRRGDGRPQHRPGADGGVPARRPGAAAQPGRRAARHHRRRERLHAGEHHRPERLPRPARPGGDDARREHGRGRPAAPRSSRRCSTRRPRRCRASRCCWRRATTSARRRRTRRCWRTCRRSTWRTRGGSTRRASATTSSTSGSTGILQHQARANFPFLATNVVETATGREPAWMKTSKVFMVNGVRVGVIGSVGAHDARARQAR